MPRTTNLSLPVIMSSVLLAVLLAFGLICWWLLPVATLAAHFGAFVGLAAVLAGLLVASLVRAWRTPALPPLPPQRANPILHATGREDFDALLDLFQDGTLTVEENDHILRANTAAEKLLAPTGPGLAGRHLADLADGAHLLALLTAIRTSAAFQAVDLRLTASNSLCNVAGVPLLHEHAGKPGQVLLVLRDISRITQLEQAGEEYAVNVSHELKTPLTLILGYTETLLADPNVTPEFRTQSLRTIERHSRRILRIVDDLLRLAWLQSERDAIGGVPITPTIVADVVAEAVSVCAEWAQQADIAIQTDIPVGLVWGLHANLMTVALANLIKNAVLYALVGPVEIRAQVLPSGNLELSVKDRGPGLKPEAAQHIFDRFYRTDKGRSRAAGGSGLGLPIVQQILLAHHGTARVETAPGAGCNFILELPPG